VVGVGKFLCPVLWWRLLCLYLCLCLCSLWFSVWVFGYLLDFVWCVWCVW